MTTSTTTFRRGAVTVAAAAAVCAAVVTTAPGASAATPPAPAAVTAAQGQNITPRPPRRSPVFARVSATGLGTLARRTFDPRSVYPCNHKVQVWINDGLRTLADFGGGERIDGVSATRALRTAGFTWDQMTTALAVMAAESDRCPKALHNNLHTTTGAVLSTDYGLWQINTLYHPRYTSWNLDDPIVNSKAAKEIFDRAGGAWTPWNGYANKDLFMPWAVQAVADAKAAGVR